MNSTRRHITPTGQSSPFLKSFPSLSIIVLTLLSLITLPIPFMTHITPAFAVMGICYFTLWQPRFVPFITLFICGLFYDTFQSTLFGTHAFLFLMLRLCLARIRNKTGFYADTLPAWGLFSIIACVYFLCEWVFLSLQLHNWRMPWTLLQRDMMSILFYPLLHIGFSSIISWIQKRL